MHTSSRILKRSFLLILAALLALLSVGGLVQSISPAQAKQIKASPLAEPAPSISFDQTRYFGNPADPTNDIAVGDLNGDGALDLVAANGTLEFGIQGQAAIYLNDGQGNYVNRRSFGGDDAAMSVALADVNGDGALDIITGNYAWIKVFLNDGQGSFYGDQLNCAAPPSPMPEDVRCVSLSIYSNEYPFHMIAGDFDGDGTLDIVYVNSDVLSPRLYLLRNAGNASFSLQMIDSDMQISRHGLAAGDLNNDGKLDIVSRHIYINNGAGVFTKSFSPFTWSNGVVDLGDMDGDGSLDIVAVLPQFKSYVYLNDGAGNFGWDTSDCAAPPDDVVCFTSPTANTTSLDLADLDGDGALDILVGNNLSSPSYAYFNLGMQAGRLAFSDGLVVGNIADAATSIHAADVNNDGSLDVIIGRNEKQSAVYLNGGQGDFTASSEFGAGFFTSIATGDLNGDGSLDFVVSYSGQGEMGAGAPTLYINDGLGRFPTSASVGRNGDAQSLAIGDIDGDGSLDIVVGYGHLWTPHATIAYLNDGSGNFCSEPACDETNSRQVGSGDDYTRSLALGDMNGDGSLDIVMGNFGYIDIHVLPIVEYGQSSYVFLNDGQGNFNQDLFDCAAPPANIRCFGSGSEKTTGLAVGDLNGDGSLDIVTGNGSFYSPNGQQNYVYFNDGSGNFSSSLPYGSGVDNTRGLALGDLNGDGSLDIVNRNDGQPDLVFLNDGAGHFFAGSLNCVAANLRCLAAGDGNNSLALVDIDGEGDLDIAAGYTARSGTVYLNDGSGNFTLEAARLFDGGANSIASGDLDRDGLPDLISGADPGQILLNRQRRPARFSGDRQALMVVNRPGDLPEAGFHHTPERLSQTVIPVSYTLYSPVTSTLPGPQDDRLGYIHAYYSVVGSGKWLPAVAATGTITSNLSASAWPTGTQHVFYWDTFASGFFGQSDDVALRLEAYPQPVPTGLAQTYLYTSTLAGDYQWPYASATTPPFRLRGTQVRVMNGDVPAVGARVYNLSSGQTSVDSPMPGGGLPPFITDAQGYLEGRGQLKPGDQLLALAPISSTETYTLFFTNGLANPLGISAFDVSTAGVQTITVSAAHPLMLFNLEISLEWDAHNDPLYLDQLAASLRRASAYLYDFTNGQVALGNVRVLQNRDDWEYANVTVMTSNRLRPWSIEGGVVVTPTVAPFSSTMQFGPGQLAIGSVWNRYGSPGQSIGEDWPLILAHELSHYMLFLGDVYMGLDANGQLVPVSTCQGSAMGDLYSDPANTEFIFNDPYWQANCSQTLANQMTHRDEWEVITGWYDHLVIPGSLNSGPSGMPYQFTSVQINDPITPTATLEDPTFYIAYSDGKLASPAARAFLEKRDTFHQSLRLINLGAPSGGQNRVAARGALLGDRLCVFDPAYAQFGCEDIALGDDTLTLRQDTSWNPVVSLTPVTSTTLNLAVSLPDSLTPYHLYARLFPDYGLPYAPVQLALDGSSYSATLQLREVTASGSLQIYVDEPTAPRRETILPFSVGGNPGYMRGSGGYMRGSGGYMRGSGGYMRGSGAGMRSGNAPILSPDGSLIFYTSSEITFTVGTLFTIQNMTGLPALPPGRSLIGQAYRIIASPGATLPEGSVSLQYLQNDVTLAGALESDLALYFYDGAAWRELTTIKDEYFNLVSAPSQGPGIYALFSSIRIPLLGPGWNNFAYPLRETRPISQTLASIAGSYSIVDAYKPGLPAGSWQVFDPSLPPGFGWVNTLNSLEFGNGYWIYATESITAHFGGAYALRSNPLGLNPGLDLSLAPATFYGVVQPGPDLLPLPGMQVSAWVNGQPRGQALTRSEGGQVVYSLQLAGSRAWHAGSLPDRRAMGAACHRLG